MKKIVVLISVLTSTIITSAQQKKNDLSQFNLKGNVKAINEITYAGKEKFGEPVKEKKTSKSYYGFNKTGYKAETTAENYKYKWKMSATYKYDGNNNIIEERGEEDGEARVAKIKYDADGDQEEVNIYDKKGRLLSKEKVISPPIDTTQEFDFISFFATRNIYNAEGELVQSILFNYFMTIEINTNTGKRKTETFEHDNRKNLVQKTVSDDKDSTIITYQYNAKDQKTQMSYKRNNSRPSVTKYEYDANGNVIKESDSYGTVKTYTYTYDKQNNWLNRIEKTSSYGEVSYEITEREIRYY